MGTVPYMSPEQVCGGRIDSRSDYFSFGAVLYEMLTGTCAFSGKSSAEIIAAILKENPLEPNVLQECPQALKETISLCIKKKPEERFQTAHDLAFSLKMISGLGTIPVASPSDRHFTRRPALWIAGLLVFLILAGLLYRFSRPGHGDEIHSLAVMPFANGSRDSELEYLSDGVTDSIINSLSQLPEIRVMAHGTVFSYKGKEVDPRKVGRDLHVDAVVTGRYFSIDSIIMPDAWMCQICAFKNRQETHNQDVYRSKRIQTNTKTCSRS